MAYLQALEDGSFKEDNSDYSLTENELFKIVQDALKKFDNKINLYKDKNMNDNYYFDVDSNLINEESISGTKRCFFAMKNSTPGGRDSLKNEQRIQMQADPFKYLFKQNKGENSFLLGIYKGPNNEPIFCTWKSVDTTSTSTVSKQIKIETISAAYKYGFERQVKREEFACAFRKEFLLFYIKNLNWIHDKQFSMATDFKSNSTLDLDLFCSGLNEKEIRNRIIFGAPGTGKSFKLNDDKDRLLEFGGEYERVTFHPDYSYANFIGTYKPVPIKDSEGKDSISYEYVPGPFMRIYVRALKNCIKVSKAEEKPKPFLLLIEEINRANTAAVFGDMFQLLDRKNNASEYPIQASEDIKKYLSKETGLSSEYFSEIKIPDNMFIWATMNSADQGVFPMDTAFKRRWDFTYLGIDDSDEDICGKYVVVGSIEQQRIEWNELRKAINEFLASEKINEDKQLGPYFIARNIVVPADGGDEIDSKKFCDVFKHKVLMYLFDDAGKQKRGKLFEGSAKGQSRYSKICEAFDEQGIGIFHGDIQANVKVQDLKTNGYDLDEKGMVKFEE